MKKSIPDMSLHEIYTHKILNVSYDTKKCVFIPSLQWHTALEK